MRHPQSGCKPGPGETRGQVTADGSALPIESPAEDALMEHSGRLVIAGGDPRIDDEKVRALREAVQR
jgi:hypothetical protein